MFVETAAFVGELGVVLSRRRTPTRASSRAMARLTPGCVRPSASAAPTKLPASTTAASMPLPLTNRASNAIFNDLLSLDK